MVMAYRELNAPHHDGQVILSAGCEWYCRHNDIVLSLTIQNPGLKVVMSQFSDYQPCTIA